jgi:nicotinamide mononucleotide (NMN) deamidase PncC
LTKTKTSDLEAKEKLLMVKDKLLNKVSEVSEDFNKDISKLIDLRGNS